MFNPVEEAVKTMTKTAIKKVKEELENSRRYHCTRIEDFNGAHYIAPNPDWDDWDYRHWFQYTVVINILAKELEEIDNAKHCLQHNNDNERGC